MKPKLLPPTYFATLLILSIILYFVFPMKIIYPPYNYSGLLLILCGIVLNLKSNTLFKKSRTTVKPNENPTELVASGPFRISRNPMYIGVTAILAGESIFLGSLITFLCPIIFVIVMNLKFIPMEEKNLEKAFGKKYLDYKKKVRMWI